MTESLELALETCAETLFGDMPDGVVIHQDGCIVYANDCITELLRCGSPSRLTGRCVLELYPEEEYPRAIRRLQAVSSGQAISPADRQRLKCMDTGSIELEVCAMQIEIPDGLLILEVMRQTEQKPTPET